MVCHAVSNDRSDQRATGCACHAHPRALGARYSAQDRRILGYLDATRNQQTRAHCAHSEPAIGSAKWACWFRLLAGVLTDWLGSDTRRRRCSAFLALVGSECLCLGVNGRRVLGRCWGGWCLAWGLG